MNSSAAAAAAAAAAATTMSLHVVVIVLGDLGRSPRMQYHVQSFLDAGHSVTFVGYTGESLIPTLTHRRFRDRLTVVRFDAPILPLKNVSLALYFVWRIISLSCLLIHTLLWRVQNQSVNLILIQNPPALPLLAVAVLYSRFYVRAPLVVDWHNLGFSMLPESSTVLRQLGLWYEQMWCPYAHGHLTVTHALQDFLRDEFHLIKGGVADGHHQGGGSGTTLTTMHEVNMDVLMDCPPALFRQRTIKEQHELLRKVDAQLCEACPKSWSAFKDPIKQTLLTEQLDGSNRYRWRTHRPALITSATSWTKDEDMGLLIEALQLLDQRIENDMATTSSSAPSPSPSTSEPSTTLKVLCVITGKGPLKETYEAQASALKMEHVALTTLWLSPEDYPKWLACADLGVSLHTSTSGRDLPIKILDYFGCEVPVAAYNFSCLYELVQDDVNGRVFTTSQELADCLWELLSPLVVVANDVHDVVDPDAGVANHDFGDLKRYSLQVQGKLLWSSNWTKHAWPVMETAVRDFNKSSHNTKVE